MKYARVVFQQEVPSPRSASIARSHWLQSFERPAFVIARHGDDVTIADSLSGKTYIYPWSLVAAAEQEQVPLEFVPAPIPEVPTPLPRNKRKSAP